MTCLIYQNKSLTKHTWNTKNNPTGKIRHDFSLVVSKHKTYCVIFCQDFPRCQESITIFVKRFS